MDSTAILRRGIGPKQPLPAVAAAAAASRLPLTFRNFSCIRLITDKANHGRQRSFAQTWNNRNAIRCEKNGGEPPNSQSGGSSSSYPDAKLALQTLLRLTADSSGWTKREEEDDLWTIKKEKKRALQYLIEEKAEAAENIMKDVYSKCKGLLPAQKEYDATLALVEILIHAGTEKGWRDALGYLNELVAWSQSQTLPSDARLPLYRAILLTLLQNDDAKNYWKTYTDFVGLGGPPI